METILKITKKDVDYLVEKKANGSIADFIRIYDVYDNYTEEGITTLVSADCDYSIGKFVELISCLKKEEIEFDAFHASGEEYGRRRVLADMPQYVSWFGELGSSNTIELLKELLKDPDNIIKNIKNKLEHLEPYGHSELRPLESNTQKYLNTLAGK